MELRDSHCVKEGNPTSGFRPGGRVVVATLMLAATAPWLHGQFASGPSINGNWSIERMKLAIQEPRIKSRIPGLECVGEVTETHQVYTGLACFNARCSLEGEKVTIKLTQGYSTLAEGSWSTSFPGIIRRSELSEGFVAADVKCEDVLIKLLSLSVFTPEDLVELAHSNIPEVRIGATANLTDQAVLRRLAADADHRIRRAAAGKLTDQAVLAKMAAGDKDPDVRKAAVEKVTDQAVLAKVATQDGGEGFRRSAVENLTDQAVLGKVATEDKDWFVRVTAVKKLTDQAVLAKVATEDNERRVRSAAVEKLTDQAVLAKVATEDKDWFVRLTAVNYLSDQAVLAKVAAEDSDSRVRNAALGKRFGR